MANFVNSQTSVPYWLMKEFHKLAVERYGKLNRMYIYMLQGFLKLEPWKANPPLPWRAARVHTTSGPGFAIGGDAGWVPMNMLLPVELSEQIKHTIEIINANQTEPGRKLSLRSFLYTAVVWWYSDVCECKGPGVLD